MSYPDDTPSWAFCMMEGCNWRGGSACVVCGARLRCVCGRFVREDRMDAHLNSGDCPVAAKWPAELAS